MILLLSILLFISASPLSAKKPVSNSEVLLDLVGVITSPRDESDSIEEVDEFPSELADIISDFYADAIVPQSVTQDVLSYLTSAYSEHGYYDSGNWGGYSRRKNQSRYSAYVPYNGELPDYEYSDFQLPVDGKLTSLYGYRPRFRRFHHGIDIALNTGDTVKCVLPGVVTKIGYQPDGYGLFIVVSHAGNVETLYGHLQKGIAKPGTKLMAGDPLGLGGTTGNATGPHLHFETRYLGAPMDPIPWFNLKSRQASP